MKRILKLLGPCLVLTLLIPGCVTRLTEIPKVSGVVVESESKTPIPAVAVYVSIDGKAQLVTVSSPEGKFTIDEKSKYLWGLPLGDRFHTGKIIFRDSGYKERVIEFGGINGNDPFLESPITIELDIQPVAGGDATR